MSELHKAYRKLKSGKSADLDSISIDICLL